MGWLEYGEAELFPLRTLEDIRLDHGGLSAC